MAMKHAHMTVKGVHDGPVDPGALNAAGAPRKPRALGDAANTHALLGFTAVVVSWASSIYALKWAWRWVAGGTHGGRVRG